MFTLLPTKFYLPSTPAGCVARPHLLTRMDGALERRLTLVSAPAGAGKTTLVSSWARSARKRGTAVGWLSLDEADNAPQRFLEYLVACLEEGGAGIDPGVRPSRKDTTSPAEHVLSDLIRASAAFNQSTVLILDDYHLIQNREVHATLGYLLDHLPPQLHLVLLTRSDPPLELARMRVAGQLAEVRMEQLRFSVQEAAAFLQKTTGVQLTQADVAALNTRTEGWAAGLQMAAISLRGREGAEDAAAFVAAFAGSHRFVFDYLLEQVLSRQPADVQSFLLKTSILDHLSAPLCDTLIETRGASRRLLDTLERTNLFLIPLDDERGWYRYHHLFADLLRLMLDRTYPGLAQELHQRACRWYEAQDMLPEALHHALAAGDVELAARIVSANVLMMMEQDEVVPAFQILTSLPRQQLEACPWLGIAQLWMLGTGQIDRPGQILDSIERHLERASDSLDPLERRRLEGHLAAARALLYNSQGDKANTVAHARQAAERLPPDDVAARAMNLAIWGDVLSVDGHDPSAMPILEEALALARQAEKPHVAMVASTTLAMAHLNAGRLRQAHQVCSEALHLAEDYQTRTQRSLSAAASIHAIMARVLAEWGENEQAIRFARAGLALSERWGQADTEWMCLQFLGRALVFAGCWEAGWQALQRANRIAGQISPWLLQMAETFALDSLLDGGNAAADEVALQVQRVEASRAHCPAPLAARLLLRAQRPDEALAVLDQALAALGGQPSYDVVRLHALRALALQARHEEQQALAVLEHALRLAEPENRLATFVREGAAMEKLLRLAARRSTCPAFARQLLAAFEAQRRPSSNPPADDALVEPLSEREVEVLHYLNTHLSTPEIAELLVVSANTVRTHIKNIYSKLGVHRRSAAVGEARRLRLLE